MEEARGATELIVAADRRLAGARVTCLARNKIGQASADYRLDIKCESSLLNRVLTNRVLVNRGLITPFSYRERSHNHNRGLVTELSKKGFLDIGLIVEVS